MISIEKPVLDVLYALQQIAPTYISGGYLRDKLIGIPPNDVDILTAMSIEDVRAVFPQLQGTESGLAFGVGRFSRGGFQFEITAREGVAIEELIAQKDFVMNSLYHDGKNLHDLFGACKDIKQKIIRPLDDPLHHAKARPEMYLRAIRLSAQVGFELEETLHKFLKANPQIFYESHESRIQQEGYRIMRAAYPLYAFELLHEFGFIADFKKECTKDWDKNRTLPPLDDKLYIRLLLFSEYTGLDYIHHFIDTFHLTKQLKEQMHHLVPYLHQDQIPQKPNTLNKVILLKRLQYEKEPQKFHVFLEQIKNSRSK